NDVPAADRQLTVRSLSVSGATVENTTAQATNDGYALAAADTYIDKFRKGGAHVTLTNGVPGAMDHVKWKQHDFHFGTEVGGTSTAASVNTYLNNPSYTNFLLQYFNTVTQGNAGKWQSNENTRNVLTMGGTDRIMQYAQANGLRVREHNLIWAAQQRAWVNTLLPNAQSSNPTTAAAAKTDLSNGITSRIAYYVGNGSATDRTKNYMEMDVLN